MRILKRKKPKIGGLILVVIITAGFAAAKEDFKTETDNLKKNFPNLRVDSVKESPIKGLYEIVAGNQVFYFSPDGYLMFGELWSKDGKNLTAEMREKVLSEKVKSIPLDKALKIGSGPRQVIEFTDPDCPYCRKVDEFLAKRTDVTRYVFFFPLRQIHPDAEKKARYILSQKDREKALREVVSGALDGKPAPESVHQDAVLEEMEQVAKSVGVRGTPALWIDGTAVNGADIPRITALLDGKEVKQ
ncbi:DsbC family protein [Geobacter argillaceus]|uniref:Thiol:disulfide interchange protein DsbC n=1 Tax=Geobacter argillaceus TaxID=345631 RepID=A0A562VP52_9BACT|nr:DsbC family protein [Geobacter argillaceus]TWJ19685.1 thiol:disulfide interchange protein DsbC [Geobacter argillaceus]